MSAPAQETEELAEFRARFREWLVANQPAEPDFELPQTFLEVESDRQFVYLRDWQKKLYEHGWLGFDVPEPYGGRGVRPELARIVSQEMATRRAPFLVNRIGLQWAGPVILMYGTEEQKQLVRHILSADHIWCQGFSEPGAGSDLASLQTRAIEQDDGSWRVTGHKVWTTLAHVARYMILLARTDASAPKYKNLTFFLFPMQGAGVTVQPLIKLTGEGGFNQVLFEDAPMPADAILGKEGGGWEVAMATLMFERGASGEATESVSEYLEVYARVVDLAKRTPRDGARAIDDGVIRDRLVQLRIDLEALSLASMRARTPELAGERPMALPLMTKLVFSEINQRLTELACEILGTDVAYWRGDPAAPDRAQWPRGYLNSFGLTIGGGTSEVLRNILAERILGLPKGK